MFTLIRCQNCGGNPVADEAMEVTVKVTVRKERCKTCYHSDENDRTFYFCGIDCLMKYLKKTGGLPCDTCHGTGWLFGIESNGKCTKCKGKKLQPSGKSPPRKPGEP